MNNDVNYLEHLIVLYRESISDIRIQMHISNKIATRISIPPLSQMFERIVRRQKIS